VKSKTGAKKKLMKQGVVFIGIFAPAAICVWFECRQSSSYATLAMQVILDKYQWILMN